ncbi:putative DNA binding domain-containing protein [Elizabethkingia anophelis]|uniref:RNA-binding domain-containing protein n=1 Tax=Elizabethkingia anophelis TaxID=1117645 RepID=UPI001623517F|nr:RNA-binding domain-containing protein [Elizabethkingia anophelis]MCT3629149.1 putative DNA binding domain-containing protein [Elizabethkingia anophelis]MCT3633004.1 putative DNA binding domain-containing protein [Elizabethkingia anophelis]MCT3829393.1 putative DNA binding domain-containing protein [Elizabethkingia anophelis]MCT3882868.1 putative DNA binding domain-containing protein [Elizabethkingia anophelis]MCT3893977.1 putative DNA binding domain-containing protein [Elizabethkingia anoph
MTGTQLKGILNYLRSLDSENEIVEFKEAKNNYDFTKLGKYFSALSNEANLCSKPYGWLVFGVKDNDHSIVGTQYRSERKDLDKLKGEIANKTTNRISFIEIYELPEPEGRVVMFKIPAAPKGIPVSFDGHYYARDGEELVPLNLEKIERIRAQATTEDWSIAIIPDAAFEDLDQDAIDLARKNYKSKFPEKAAEVDTWDDVKFLNKAKVTIKGKITRTALILLGKDESEHFLNPAEVKIRWKLVDENNNDIDYEIFGLPLILSVEKVFAKIRNIKYRYMKEGTIFPDEVAKYEPFSIREAINNCIAHQDYTKGARINVIEMEDQLVFTNHGTFIPGSVEKVVIEDAPEEFYRNKFLATAMFNLKMVDTAGGGIKKIFNFQRARYFPMPDYDLSEEKVKMSISGKILDMDYARLLAQNKDLSLEEIMMLDKLQKKNPLTAFEEKHLKSKKLIEGRKPNYFIGLKVAQNTGQKAEYSKNKGFDKKYYLDLIVKSIKEHKELTRSDVDALLWNKLPEWMEEQQKKNKIGNLLSELRIKEIIENKGTFGNPKWSLKK